MDTKNLKFVQGALAKGEPATIRFIDDIDSWSVSSFTEEFEYLENYIKPSEIKILINSAGGSVLHGMNAFSKIINSETPTEAVVEGLAASMASVLLAAADVIKMRDYGIIMIHNPFNPSTSSEDSATIAFKNQLKTIYKSRWGFTEDKINEVMNGKEGEDGTFINAKEAIELGIVSKENIIKTQKQKRDSIKNKVEGAKSAKAIADIYASLSFSEENIKSTVDTSTTKNDNNNKVKKMDELQIVIAALGNKSCATGADVVSEINALKKDVSEAKAIKEQMNALTLAKATADAELKSAKDSLNESAKELKTAKAALEVFKAKEVEKQEAEKTAFIDAAIKEGKITEDSRETWSTLAKVNFESVKNAINGLSAKTVISDEIEASTDDVKTQNTEAEADIAKVDAVVGSDFAYSTSFN